MHADVLPENLNFLFYPRRPSVLDPRNSTYFMIPSLIVFCDAPTSFVPAAPSTTSTLFSFPLAAPFGPRCWDTRTRTIPSSLLSADVYAFVRAAAPSTSTFFFLFLGRPWPSLAVLRCWDPGERLQPLTSPSPSGMIRMYLLRYNPTSNLEGVRDRVQGGHERGGGGGAG